MLKWQDDKGRDGAITSASAFVCGVRIVIHRHIDHAPEQWLLTTSPDHFTARPLSLGTIDEAKSAALGILVRHFRKISDEISAATDV